MQEIYCPVCGELLTLGLNDFGDVGQNKCWDCFVYTEDVTLTEKGNVGSERLLKISGKERPIQMDVHLNSEAALLFAHVQLGLDLTDNIPAMSDEDIIHFALLTLDYVRNASPETTATILNQVIIADFEASKKR